MSVLIRTWQRFFPAVDEIDADELRRTTDRLGARSIADLRFREVATVSGSVRSTTMSPQGTTPTLTAELYDGTQRLDVIWLGRSTIGGIHPGTYLRVTGRVCDRGGVPTIYNPTYDILPNRGH